MRKIGDKKGQVWVETVIYTLIGLAVIGLVLAGALPKINAKKDEVMIDQSIQALGLINDKIYEVQRGVGNRRVISLEVKSGSFVVDISRDTLSWELESSFPYSEVGLPVSIGDITVTTTGDDPWQIELKAEYGSDLTFAGETSGTKRLDAAPTAYSFSIENNGKNSNGNTIINLNEA